MQPLTFAERIVEVALLAAVAIPFARVAIDAGLRRRFQAFPAIRLLLAASLVAYAGVVTLAAVFAPALLRVLASAALVLIAWHAWQARTSFGSARKLPPGSLSFIPSGPWRDPDYYRKRARRHGEVFKFRHFAEPAVAVVGLQRIGEFMRVNEGQLVVPPAPFNAIVPGGFVRYSTGASHLNVATALRAAFTAAVIDSSSDVFREEAVDALRKIASGTAAPSALDRMVLSAMMASFLGIRPGREFDRLEQLFDRADYRTLDDSGKDRATSALGLLIARMQTLASQLNGKQTFLSELVAARPDALDSEEILGNLAYALHTGRVDASGCLVWVVAMLGDNPEWVRRLRAEVARDPAEAACSGGLADRIVRETLRLRQSEFLLRRTTAEVNVDGFTIPAGWHVRLCIAESHRSADSFDDPDAFNPDRFLRSQGRARYAPFGFAPHLCPGEHLTRALGRHLVVELASRYDVEASNVEPWEFSGFHWRPNPAMRVSLKPVTA